MAPTFDVPGRLAQGRPSVDAMSEYVWAAHQVGFTDPDLTLHPGQVRDWYGTEDGMDLAVLQRDCAAIDSAVRATRDALAVQEEQTGVLSGAWQGSGAQAARQFLHRHGVASAAVADALVAAAAALQRTLEQLWRAVDAKVETTVAIESEVGAAREQWRAAAATVSSGVGDRVAAAELVDSAVKPFVQSRIGAEWLTAMQATGGDVADAYRAAAAEITGRPSAVFEIPGALGPSAPAAPPSAFASAPAAAPAAAAAALPAPTGPAAWTAPPSAAAPAAPAAPPPAAPPPAPASLPEAAAPLASPEMPAVGQRFADALSGLLGGGTGDGLTGDAIDPLDDLEPPEPADEDDEEPDEEETEDDEPEGDETVAEEPVAEPVSEEEGEAVSEEDPQESVPEAVAPPEPTPPPPPAEPLPPPPPVEKRTPCEIAADEVPQVGPPPASEPGGG